MGFDVRPSPARVSAGAAAAFPRRALLLLLAVYIVAGLFGRDPWMQGDAAGFGVMWTMAHGAALDWWLPNVAGEFLAEEGPLPFWIGALLIRLFGPWLGDATAARLTTLLWFTLAIASVWYATYRLARREEAQPVAFAFGGEASPADYGRMLADISVLLLVATVGLALRMHETSAETASIALAGLTLLGVALALERASTGALVTGVSIGLMALSGGPHVAVFVAIGALATFALLLDRAARVSSIAIVVVVAAAVFALWPLGSLLAPDDARREFFSAWRIWALGSFGVAGVADAGGFVRTLAWTLWPLWPFALWAIYAWRHGLARAHIVVPGAVAIALLLGAFATPYTRSTSLLLAIPLAVLAPFGVVTVRRAAENAIDWFAIVTFSFFGLAAWAYYIAMQTGTPPRMAASVARLTPGFAPTVDVVALLLALAASAGWIALVVWRVSRRPEPLWRGPLLSAGGLVLLWVVVMTLYLRPMNYNRSYAPIAAEIRQQIDKLGGPGACVLAHGLRPAYRAVLAYHGGIRFGGPRSDCPLALQRDMGYTQLDDQPPSGDWRVAWEGRWAVRPDEVFRLYRRGSM